MEEGRHQFAQVQRGIRAFADAMGTIRIGHHPELFVMADELVDQRFRALVVAIVIAGAVNQ